MQQLIDFALELDRLKSVTRKIKPAGQDRYENPAEHSWHLALFASALASHAAEPVDVSRVIEMLLVHDVGEIETGDTSAFIADGLDERKAAELKAITRIFGLLDEPQRSRLIGLWLEFEAAETPEARFAHAVDRAMPVLLNLANDGQSWRESRISYDRVVARVRPEIEGGCPALWQHIAARLEAKRTEGWFGMA